MAAQVMKFGTSGWRGIIGEEFTFPRVRLAARAVCDHLKAAGQASNGLCIGHDPRYLSEYFAAEVASTAEAEGIEAVLSATHLPTPVVSHAVRSRSLGGAVNITASHNPAPWSGFKFNNHRGAPAPPDATRDLEERIGALRIDPGEEWFAREPVKVHKGAGSPVPPRDESLFAPYLEDLARIVRFDEIKASGITVAVDPLWGAAVGYLSEILRRKGIPVVTLHEERDVNFGGLGPDPAGRNLAELQALVSSGQARVGIANDGDADRFGIVDSDGTIVSANSVLALLADYLAESRGWRHGLARTYATTRLVDAVADHYGMDLHQTPVGFKYLGELILEGRAFLAGEESAGMSVAGHVPEKDGMIAGLLVAEMVAARGRSLGEMLEALHNKVGAYHSARQDAPVTPDQVRRLRERMKAPPEKVGARPVDSATVLDGLRLDFADGAWLLMRPSGTEPVVRYYVEARTPGDLDALIRDGKTALLG